MKSVQWLFLVSAMLFVGGIAFIIAAERTRQALPDATSAPVALKSVASVKQIMNAIVVPSSTVLYQSVSTTISERGVEEVKPQNDAEWAALAANSAALAEAGNLLMASDRAIDQADWMMMSRAMVDAATAAAKAAEAKSTEAVLETGAQVNETCDQCHARYQRQ